MGDLIDARDVLTTLKILVIGESGAGKSSLLVQFTDNTFDTKQTATIGVDYKEKLVKINGETVKLAIWDTAGQERFRSLTPSFYRGGQGIIVVYDISNRESFTRVENWLSELEVYSTNQDVVKMLVGNKPVVPGTGRVIGLLVLMVPYWQVISGSSDLYQERAQNNLI